MSVPGFYSLVLEDADSLSAAWLPFLEPGGLFVATRRDHFPGEEVVLLLQLPDGEKRSVAGSIAWISAEDLSGQPPGAGVALDGEEGQALAETIRRIVREAPSPAEALLARF
ncbi:MAG: pilus assembly protein PilZ [Gammaproteobacteria bacterium]|nr:pilus assembly protein PilZ [Gammaproteobacteria bacterium]MXW44692.1 pilus assembly protein PilZ [Gammaproteobacteria bacterium]MYD02389.1 pilus assembly protein PilZ [Gammaproteobacteria bacterium]MYI24853.1 pilus assembly protein PilZ [Gammaproteobacteria bacterium]